MSEAFPWHKTDFKEHVQLQSLARLTAAATSGTRSSFTEIYRRCSDGSKRHEHESKSRAGETMRIN